MLINVTIEDTIEVNIMSFLKHLRRKERKAVKWVLKAKPADSSDWEDIETYEEEKSYSDLKDVIEELRNDGYEAVRLDGYDEHGRFVRRGFVRYFGMSKALSTYRQFQKTLTELMSNQINIMNETLRAQTQMLKELADLKASLSSSKMGYEDAIAQVLYLEELKKTLAEALGLSSGQVSNPQFQAFLMEIMREVIKKYLPEIEQRLKERFGSTKESKTAPPTTSTPTPPTPIITPPPTLPKAEVPPEIQKVIEDAKKKVFEETLPPCVKQGICKEGEETVEEGGG